VECDEVVFRVRALENVCGGCCCSIKTLENVKQSRVRLVQDAVREDMLFYREAAWNKALHTLWYHPTSTVQLWCPFVFVLLVCLKVDGVSAELSVESFVFVVHFNLTRNWKPFDCVWVVST
jgi:hypothetical protein